MAMENKAFEFGPFRMDIRERRLTRDGHPVALRRRVFDTLLTLVRRHGCLVTKDELMATIWPDSVVEETNLNHNICVLRRALGERATGQKYVETIPRQGYRFVADVKEFDVPKDPNYPNSWDIQQDEHFTAMSGLKGLKVSSDTHPQLAIPGREQKSLHLARTRWYPGRSLTTLLTIAAFLVAGYVVITWLSSAGKDSNERIMLAVLPFENLTGDPAQRYFADGLSNEIISELGGWNPEKLGVIARTSSRVYLDARKSIREIGRELGVDYIIEGSVRRSNGHYRITAMLVRVENQAHIWSANYDQADSDVTASQIETARMIIREVGNRVAVEPSERSRVVTPSGLEGSRNGKERAAVDNSKATISPK